MAWQRRPKLDTDAALPHTRLVSIRLLTVVETSAFARRAEKLLSTEEHEELLFFLALHPQSGDEIPGKAACARCGLRRGAKENPAACG